MTDQNMAMMGLAKVRKTSYQGKPAIHKKPVTQTESYFYQNVLQQPGAQAISAPALLSAPLGDGLWLEHIPEPVTQDETSEPGFMNCLIKIHEADLSLDEAQLFHFQWMAEDTERAIARFDTDQQRLIERHIRVFFDRQSALFEPIGPVSGDTNVFNWGRRSNGGLVLFDWERFGLASPAMDLAPMIPGLPDISLVDRFCENYRSLRNSLGLDGLEIRRQVLTAMAWLVIEVSNILHDRGNENTPLYMEWFNTYYGRWLANNMRYL